MHMYTRLSDESRYLAAPYTTEHDFYGSGLIEHDQQIGDLLDSMEEMGILDNTIVIYSTDNGPEHSARLHGGTTPFRGEKMTTYEGGVRVPLMIRWPGKIPAGTVLSGIQTHMDIYASLAAAAGEPNVVEKVKKEQKQYLDGVNNLDYWMGKTAESKRNHFLYYYESSIKAVRYNQWKVHFETSENYYDVYEKQKFPIMYNLRLDPFESFDGLTDRSNIVQAKQWLNEPIQQLLGEHIQSLMAYPPLQKAASFDFSALIDQMMKGKE